MEAPELEDVKPVGRLHLFSSVRGPEKDFLLYPGKNVVGRRPGCTVALPFLSISKIHAIIEIPAQGTSSILRDCGSLNGTRLLRPLRRLSPGVDHQLGDQDLVFFASLPCQYHHLGVPLLCDPQEVLIMEETPSDPVMGGPQFQETLLAEDSKEERGLHDKKLVPLEEVSMDDQNSSDVPSVASIVPVPEAPAPAWTPRITLSKLLESFSSPVSQESPILGRGRGREQEREKAEERSQGNLQAPNIESLLPQDSRHKSESSFQRQIQKPFNRSSVPTAPLVPELHPAIPKELPLVAEPHLKTYQRLKREATQMGASTQILPVLYESPFSIPRESSEASVRESMALQSQRVGMGETCESLPVTPEPSNSLIPEAPARRASKSQRVGAVGMPGSTVEVQPKFRGLKRTPATKELSPCPKQSRRGRPWRQANSKKEEDKKTVDVETAVKTSEGAVEVALKPKEKVKGSIMVHH
ncbi:uncharacterized protein LOC141498473 [Macrotis lagotis]|uniref:uncharacterized protein LOC141498473 n=1 Tax=Macrotis lagotis TaxID=92651 RepID=UPI003D686942